MKHPFEGLWLIHYYFGLTPWLTISDLPEEAALEINRLTGKTAGLCPDTGRERYYQVRLEVEEWDRRQHLARGGAVEHVNPVYAMLSETELATRAARAGNAVAIPADMVPADLMSVSVGDSFPNFFAFRRGESGLLGTTFSPAEFMQLFSSHSLPTKWPEGYDGPEGFCIEVRIYARPTLVAQRPAAGPIVCSQTKTVDPR